NDVHAHALGEARRGTGVGYASSIVVGIGTGVGGAFVGGEHIMLGAHMQAGHIGHVHCAEAAGMPCDCGATGHMECIASGTAITESYIRFGGDGTYERDGETVPMDGAEINRRALELDDGNAIAAQQLAGFALGSVVAGVCSMLDPDCVILSGSVINCGHYWHDAVTQGFAETAMEPLRGTPILLASLGDNAPLIGAAEHFVRSAYADI
ncbi:MAG: ROK family protein, partial [Atopobiaceae bacterium]|nr:ROK family protein [Atopobiaceae bacterium]